MDLSDPSHLAGGILVGGFDGTTLPEPIRARLAQGHLAGVTLFRRNVLSPAQVLDLCRAAAAAAPAGQPPLLSIDQEGGRVARLGAPVKVLPPMRHLGARDDVALTRRAGAVMGAELAAIGINLDFAPVCDVDSNPANPVIGDRAFARDADTVARHAAALLEGLQGAGVAACAKHFPGHGDTETDSHLELPRVRHPRARLEALEVPPFRAAYAAGVASVMSAHVVFDALDPGVPATLSRAVMQGLLRDTLGFGGVAFSDDLHMKAVSARWSVEDCAVRAVEAGCDALLVCADPDAQERARLALAARAARDTAFRARLEEAYGRVLALRRRYPPAPLPDAAALAALLDRAEHHALLAELAAR